MEEDEGGIRLSKRFSDQGGEVDYKTKAGTAWSHNFLNQKPWHPLSYPNQRRKWIAEQQHAQHQRRVEEVAREYAQEQEFFRQTALISKKEKEKIENMQAVSFMYVRPPGYNAESAKAAEVVDQERKQCNTTDQAGTSAASVAQESGQAKVEKKKPRPKDVFGRHLPTEEQFSVLKNAPRLETGVHGRSKPFAVEVRNVKCVRCGNFGHQSGDRECPLKDVVMPTEESRLKRDDPLTAIMAHTESTEPLKWELKQKPGISPPRGGFQADDPNQQIVAEDIFDEYGGFLNGGIIPELLTSVQLSKPRKKRCKSKHRKQLSEESTSDYDDSHYRSKRKDKERCKRSKKKQNLTDYSQEDNSTSNSDDGHQGLRRKDKSGKSKKKRGHMEYSQENNSSSDSDDGHQKSWRKERGRSDRSKKREDHFEYISDNKSTSDGNYRLQRSRRKEKRKSVQSNKRHTKCEYSPEDDSRSDVDDRDLRSRRKGKDKSEQLKKRHDASGYNQEETSTSDDSDRRSRKEKKRRGKKRGDYSESSLSEDPYTEKRNRRKHSSYMSDVSDCHYPKHSSKGHTKSKTQYEVRAIPGDVDKRSSKKMAGTESTRTNYHCESSQDSDMVRWSDRKRYRYK